MRKLVLVISITLLNSMVFANVPAACQLSINASERVATTGEMAKDSAYDHYDLAKMAFDRSDVQTVKREVLIGKSEINRARALLLSAAFQVENARKICAGNDISTEEINQLQSDWKELLAELEVLEEGFVQLESSLQN